MVCLVPDRAYRFTKPLPLTVEFPKTRHEIFAREQEGGHAPGGEPVYKLFADTYPVGGLRSTGQWVLAEGLGARSLNAITHGSGFSLSWPSGAATIMEKAVKLGFAERLQ